MGIFEFIKKKYQEGKEEYKRCSGDVAMLKKRELYMGAGKKYYELCPELLNAKDAETETDPASEMQMNPVPSESVMKSKEKIQIQKS